MKSLKNQHCHPKDFIKISSLKFSSKTAVIYNDTRITYKELNDKINIAGNIFKSSGIKKGDAAVILMRNCPEFIVSFFALLQIGAVSFPISPKLSVKEIRKLLIDSKASRLIYAEEKYLAGDILTGTPVKTVLFFPETGKFPVSEENISVENRPLAGSNSFREDKKFAIRQFSSGSTGEPKHMLLTSKNLFYQALQFTRTTSITSNEIFVGVVPFCHSYGMLNILPVFYTGSAVVVMKEFIPSYCLEVIEKYKATVFLATPFMLELFSDCYRRENGKSLNTLKLCVSSTTFLSKEVYEKFNSKYHIPVFVQYGSTETGAVTINLSGEFKENCVGKPFFKAKIKVFDENFKPVHKGSGKVGIKTPSACKSYVDGNKKSKTFNKGYVFPGDIGYIDKNNNVYILGRDDIINVGGLKVDKLEVERVLKSCPRIKDAVVYGVTRKDTQIVHAAVLPNKGAVKEEIFSYCRKKLTDYKVPKKITFLDKFPRDERGKILKEDLEKL